MNAFLLTLIDPSIDSCIEPRIRPCIDPCVDLWAEWEQVRLVELLTGQVQGYRVPLNKVPLQPSRYWCYRSEYYAHVWREIGNFNMFCYHLIYVQRLYQMVGLNARTANGN